MIESDARSIDVALDMIRAVVDDAVGRAVVHPLDLLEDLETHLRDLADDQDHLADRRDDLNARRRRNFDMRILAAELDR